MLPPFPLSVSGDKEPCCHFGLEDRDVLRRNAVRCAAASQHVGKCRILDAGDAAEPACVVDARLNAIQGRVADGIRSTGGDLCGTHGVDTVLIGTCGKMLGREDDGQKRSERSALHHSEAAFAPWHFYIYTRPWFRHRLTRPQAGSGGRLATWRSDGRSYARPS